MWNVSMARYSKRCNSVSERRVRRFPQGSHDEAFDYINKHGDRAIYVWHENASELENPYFAMAETDAYKEEWNKIQD